MGAVVAPLLPELAPQQDAGSVIVIMATDAPLDGRQLSRIARRAGAGLGRIGSYWGHGSGDIALAFSTDPSPRPPADDALEPLLAAVANATEHAVVDALLSATPLPVFAGIIALRCGRCWTAWHSVIFIKEPHLRVLISTDIEGIAGVTGREQCRAGSVEYPLARADGTGSQRRYRRSFRRRRQ